MTAPRQFDLRVQHGIAGGFIAPTPTAIHEVSLAESSTSLKITSIPTAQNQTPFTTKSLDLAHSDTQDLVAELHSILKALPSDEDIYGLNVGIAWESADLKWSNMSPRGDGIGNDFRATDDQLAQFTRAVAIGDELVRRGE